MPIVTFWSNSEKSIGQTVSAALTATVTAIEHNYKVLLISADFNDKIVESSFGAQESNDNIVKGLIKKEQVNLGSGIQGLLKLADSNRVTPEMIHDYTKIVFKNRLEILYSPFVEEDTDRQEIMKQINNIIVNASRYYDYVFVDLKKGIEYNEQEEILNMSDVIVFNIDQRIDTIESALSSEKVQELYNKIIWNMCKTDKNTKYNFKNITRRFFKNEKVHEIDYNTLVFEASQEGKIAELMLRLKTIKEDDSNYELMLKIKKLIEEIILTYRQSRSRM